MKFELLPLFIISAAYAASLPFDNKIIGGKEVVIEDFPFQVALYYNEEYHCGGSIINENTILTAAHCLYKRDPNQFTIEVGNTKLTHDPKNLHNVSKTIQHENFDYTSADYDIAVLKLETPLKYSNNIQPIELQEENKEVNEGTIAWVSGWGFTYSQHDSLLNLHAADVGVVSYEKCNEAYDEGITTRMICAQSQGHDSCQGDSGGPLVANNRLIGVVSWGYNCADPKHPGVYAKVSNLYSWIVKNI